MTLFILTNIVLVLAEPRVNAAVHTHAGAPVVNSRSYMTHCKAVFFAADGLNLDVPWILAMPVRGRSARALVV